MTDLLEKLIDGNGWLPIEEPPKVSGGVLLRGENEYPAMGYWHNGILDAGWVTDGDFEEGLTYYQPIDAAELLVTEIKRLREENAIMREALEKLARLGTGSSHSNMIAKQAIEWADELSGGE
jgi:hypothetical protein